MRRSVRRSAFAIAAHLCTPLFLLTTFVEVLHAGDDLPIVPDGFVVDVVAKEPMVSNPCVMAFDKLGRICVAQGPQWRAPTPETPGDRIDILFDDDDDGIADRRHTFADGFNSVQGIAWHGDDLWVANAPDLTVVRDTNGDDVADEYTRVYTGLGNLEHSLHGLNFGPDGRLYMSKGNSKGYNRLDQLAPKAFRELWGLESPAGAPDYTPIEVTDRAGYKRAYHTPQDDWGQQGGILRCDPYHDGKVSGRNLEIVSQGFRNPWDITFDDGFNWLGTDNDQTQGDRIFMPFYGAHFGWGHSWSFHWTGEKHLPTVPVSSPLYEGSGAGLIHYHATHFPKQYRNAFFVNDWMRREIYLLKPEWDGALMKCKGGTPEVFAHANGGRSLPASSGRVFEPTDIEVGPDGALYVLSWGHGYGGTLKDGKQIDAGRVYRIRHKDSPLTKWSKEHRTKPHSEWTAEQLIADLGRSVPAWRVNAQRELTQRMSLSEALATWLKGNPNSQFRSVGDDLPKLLSIAQTKAQQTWLLWTFGRSWKEDPQLEDGLKRLINSEEAPPGARLQAIRILTFRHRERKKIGWPGLERGTSETPGLPSQAQSSPGHPDLFSQLLSDENARIRHEAVQAIWQMRLESAVPQLLNLAARETDRVVFYSTWNALRELAPVDVRKAWLKDERPGVQLAALLGLFENDEVTTDEVLHLRTSPHEDVADLVEMWLQKTGAAEPLVTLTPPPGEYSEPVSVALKTSLPNARLNYTLDGSTPANTSPTYSGPISIEGSQTLRIAVTQDLLQAGRVITAEYKIRTVPPYRHREFITDVRAKKPRTYELDWTGITTGKRMYTDRDYHVTSVPFAVSRLPYLRTYNNHDREPGDDFLSFDSDCDVRVLLGIDVRINEPLTWMKIGQTNGFKDTGLEIPSTDATFRLYEKSFAAGRITLGGNVNDPRNDSPRGNYIVLFDHDLLGPAQQMAATEADILAAMPTADPERGRELFLHPKGAGCVKCHLMEGLGVKFAPDLSNIGSRAKKAEILIPSIINPSDVITEGYAVQQVVTTDGKSFAGSVLEETGRTLKLVDSNAKVTEIAKADIEERIGTKLSPMPAGFNKMLTAQQVADVVAWLMNQKSVGDPNGFSFRDHDDKFDIYFGEQRIATYLKRHDKLTRRALVNVTTPGGIQVTRNFPPRAPEDIDPGYKAENGIIHPHMHPGIWLGFGDVNGNDYWRLQARVVFDGFVEPPKGDRSSGTFAVRNLFLREGAPIPTRSVSEAPPADDQTTSGSTLTGASAHDAEDIVCEEITRYIFERVPEGLLLRLTAEYSSDNHDFYFGDQEESGLAVRVASPIRVQGGNGTIVNDRGERNGGEIWGKEAKWFDYFGTIDGREVGVMVVPDPGNSRPSWLHARDYGVIVTNPFPKQPKERREPYVKTQVKRGETFRLSYAILIHDLPSATPLDRDAKANTISQALNGE